VQLRLPDHPLARPERPPPLNGGKERSTLVRGASGPAPAVSHGGCCPITNARSQTQIRRHLNGLAMRDGPRRLHYRGEPLRCCRWLARPTYRRRVVIYVSTNEIPLAGLSIPHSPRWYDKSALRTGVGRRLVRPRRPWTVPASCLLPRLRAQLARMRSCVQKVLQFGHGCGEV
jgi:hypothetical protein